MKFSYHSKDLDAAKEDTTSEDSSSNLIATIENDDIVDTNNE
jgi:hypothetical protein